MKHIFNTITAVLVALLSLSSCSDQYMNALNTDPSKSPSMDPNAFLTTALLQTYGDFGMMDTYRSYITGFTQHMGGGWNVSNYAGSVHANNDQMRLIWDRLYGVGIKNLMEGIEKSADMPNLNAVLRIHRVYLLSILTDTYGDVPCMDAGKGDANPVYDPQKDIYDFFFTELTACAQQLGTGEDEVTGDVTAYDGNLAKWKKYANSLRLRFAMRISDVDSAKARAEFEAALADAGGIIDAAEDDAYVIYLDAPFTLYDGARDLDFRANALGEILYGQDPESPSFVCATLFNQLKNTADPRLYRICRHYINTLRSDVSPDDLGNVDVTDEVRAWEIASGLGSHPCNPGAAWWDNWVSAPANSDIPTLEALVEKNPNAGYDKNNYNVRMIRPFLNINFERPNCPGILLTSAEVEFLLSEAADNGWTVTGTAEDHFKAGITASMKLLNEHYLPVAQTISDADINTFITNLLTVTPFAGNARMLINTQAWILHLTNPSECWANLRRSDYPVLMDRTKLDRFPSDFTYDDEDLSTPNRLRYPDLEAQYNARNYKEAIGRAPLNGKDDWHARVWWDTANINVE
ncbi:MAG: SusD/RagB family nutrient-binding outer membrane lipoprotein [Bacteroidales bacterium]|nr:SusD/RagB family nutrient-binding outer membrane lipoprotein [Bacteroidales bacterium]